ncbi:membrane protein [Kaistia sp. 32K]|uniref:isoprenylcysteine carboxyl methyltransferase family protein n=1 Tax=Kaistia sp. 32K TaxID=2795690 RepID=UPI001916C4E6|nr:isoprenylcysteine carboxylmethyltransferase family protein [Kaistia sp. 32K]BCP53553.1 membrane protein [Kaistia sp. 32K]
MSLGWAYWLLLAVALQRGVELIRARRNTRALLARGGREVGREHYPVIVALHAAWLATLALLTAPDPPVQWILIAAFALLQLLRLWVLASLGPYWTTRIITIDDAPLRATGPYRFLRHPNYVVVALEIPLLALILDLPVAALVFGVLNLAVLAFRIRIENQALLARRPSADHAESRSSKASATISVAARKSDS